LEFEGTDFILRGDLNGTVIIFSKTQLYVDGKLVESP